eukprot:g17895.t1
MGLLFFLVGYLASSSLFSIFRCAEAFVAQAVDNYCLCVASSLCDYVEDSSVVLHGTVLSRSGDDNILKAPTSSGFGDPLEVYTVGVTMFYKTDPTATLTKQVLIAKKIEFVTGGIPYSCGVSPTIGEEYLMGFYRDSDGQLRANSCTLFQLWDTVTPIDIDALDGGCIEESECEACGELQECVKYSGNGKYYCSDTCEEDACTKEETCTLRARKWCRDSGFEICPKTRACV